MRLKGYQVFTGPGELNIVYVEGVTVFGQNHPDDWNRFNDACFIVHYLDGVPQILFRATCTTEPGYKPTLTLAALKRGGIFRIMFGQYLECWQVGYHKGNKNHEALVQVEGSKIYGHRDKNRDGKRTGDKISVGTGINQHGTRPGFLGKLVDFFSEGCLVRRMWVDQIEFMSWVKSDVRYKAYGDLFRFSTTIIAGDDMNKRFPA